VFADIWQPRHCGGIDKLRKPIPNLTEEGVGINFGKNLTNGKWDYWGRISSEWPMRIIFEKCLTSKWNARGFNLTVCLWLASACVCTSAHGFSLLGPYESWMQQSNGFRLAFDISGPPLDLALPSLPFPEPGDIGGPMTLSNGYRWNVPVVTYGFDSSFLQYFGSNGVAAVQEAIQILNDLPAASEIDATNYPDFSIVTNSVALADNLLDLRSATLSLLLEQLGLASPTASIYELTWRPISGGDVYQIIVRNYDPTTLTASEYINGIQYIYSIVDCNTIGLNLQFAETLPLLGNPPFTAVAEKINGFGEVFSGLTADDAAGLQYLYSSNNINYEPLLPGVAGAGSNLNSFVNGAWRPGVEKIKFVPQPYDPQSLQFLILTNEYLDTYVTNGVVFQQQLQRVVMQPDFLFSAGDTEPDYPVVVPYSRSGTSNWINNADANQGTPGSGPGIITPPVRITFTALGKQTLVQGTNLVQQVSDESYYWASFDGSSNSPVVYPNAQPAQGGLSVRLWFESWVSNELFPQGSKVDFNLSGPAGTPVVLQTSTNLTDWVSFATNQINGSIWTVIDEPPISAPRFYRTISQ
jgi:hypothetical protein